MQKNSAGTLGRYHWYPVVRGTAAGAVPPYSVAKIESMELSDGRPAFKIGKPSADEDDALICLGPRGMGDGINRSEGIIYGAALARTAAASYSIGATVGTNTDWALTTSATAGRFTYLGKIKDNVGLVIPIVGAGEPNKLILVSMTQTGGSEGALDQRCSWRYTVSDFFSQEVLREDYNPERSIDYPGYPSPYLGNGYSPRHPFGRMLKADIGLGFWYLDQSTQQEDFRVIWCNEVLVTEGCGGGGAG